MKKLKTILYTIIVVGALVYAFVESPNLNPIYLDGALFWGVVFSAFAGVTILFKFGEVTFNGMGGTESPFSYTSKGKVTKNSLILIAAPWVIIGVVIILSSFVINWKAYRDQLGEPDVRAFSSDVQAIDINQIPVVDQQVAFKVAQKKLGERPSLGSQVVLGEPVMQRVNNKLVWVTPLHHSGFFKWLTNMEGTPGYIVVSATNSNDVDYIDSYNIKYQPNGFIFDNLKRYTRFTAAPFKGVADYSFEIDDSGNPFWVVTTYKNKRGFNLPEADGVIIINASTGEKQSYKLGETPEWVDRVQPEDFLMSQITNRGKYVHGIFNFSNKDKFKPSAGKAIVYNDNRCYMFTGITSVGSDESAIGFMMIDMVTKEVIQYQIAGATEMAAQKSAEGKVQEKRYVASYPIILNVGGHPTFFMTLKDNEGLVKQYAFVSVVNYSSVGTGETMSDAMRDYENIMRGVSSGSGNVDLAPSQTETVNGTVLRIAQEMSRDIAMYKIILAEYPDQIFTVEATVSDELALTQAGDKVSLAYLPNVTNILMVSSFDNLLFDQGAKDTASSAPESAPEASVPESAPEVASSSMPQTDGASSAA